MADELLSKINALAKKKREQGLTEEEQKLQKELYAEYLKNFRKNFSKQLDNVDVEYPDGTVIPLKDVPKKDNK
ncbi:MAG: DUF896 domain-containing protein [Oscillospiraceae bacterium]|nr:DUF896 domain-containing protein [Candidatus Ruminococcus equi]